MASIKVNLGTTETFKSSVLSKLKDKNFLLRRLATDMLPIITERIHTEGLKSDGKKIGTYSNAYLNYRNREYKYPKSQTQIILQLTTTMASSWATVETTNGWGIGFTNPEMYTILGYLEKRFGKIGSLTKKELDMVDEFVSTIVKEAVNDD